VRNIGTFLDNCHMFFIKSKCSLTTFNCLLSLLNSLFVPLKMHRLFYNELLAIAQCTINI
jgi:hypothetical protein